MKMTYFAVLAILLLNSYSYGESLVCTAEILQSGQTLWSDTIVSEDLSDLHGTWSNPQGSLSNEELDFYGRVTAIRAPEGFLYGSIEIDGPKCGGGALNLVYRSVKEVDKGNDPANVTADCYGRLFSKAQLVTIRCATKD